MQAGEASELFSDQIKLICGRFTAFTQSLFVSFYLKKM